MIATGQTERLALTPDMTLVADVYAALAAQGAPATLLPAVMLLLAQERAEGVRDAIMLLGLVEGVGLALIAAQPLHYVLAALALAVVAVGVALWEVRW